MAIQTIDLRVPDGDTPKSANTKINNNFTNTAHAASRLVGASNGQIPLVENVLEAKLKGIPVYDASTRVETNAGTSILYNRAIIEDTSTLPPDIGGWFIVETARLMPVAIGSYTYSVAFDSSNGFYTKSSGSSLWAKYYSTRNTTVDSNKNIKQSSPVVRVFADHLDKIHEANELPIKYTRNGVGDYTIEGTTGLRENDWQIVIPKDDHDNQLIAFTIKDDNGTIHLKTYKRIFNMNTFMFEPDLNTPMDIPDGRWIDLHFNDLPKSDTHNDDLLSKV